ncbi:unnamed protein product, partial [marine sediment metagenome]
MSEEDNKTIATEISFKIRRIADAFNLANECREEGDEFGWWNKLTSILIAISSKLTPTNYKNV